jgi:uncharacterized protein YndB with AHSA1/START domain
MKKLHLTILIDAPKKKVWHTMLDPEGFEIWTALFCEGSYFEGSWNKGEKIRFLTPDGNGMTSMIAENKPFEFVSIKHLGIIKEGVDDLESPDSKTWANVFENYTFTERDGATEVKVEMDVPPEYEQFMNRTWPKALARLKEICEK